MKHLSNINLNNVDWPFFATMIEGRRKYLGWSRQDIAFALKLSPKDIRLAAQKRQVSLKAYTAFCRWYRVRFEWFYRADLLSTRGSQ